jgi:hypothetical protein
LSFLSSSLIRGESLFVLLITPEPLPPKLQISAIQFVVASEDVQAHPNWADCGSTVREMEYRRNAVAKVGAKPESRYEVLPIASGFPRNSKGRFVSGLLGWNCLGSHFFTAVLGSAGAGVDAADFFGASALRGKEEDVH